MEKKSYLDVSELADLLRIPSEKVLRWVSQGQVPCRFKKNKCYFKKKEILEWAKSHDLMTFDVERPDKTQKETSFNLKTGIERGGIDFGLPGDDRLSVLRNAANLIPLPPSIEYTTVLEALLEREKIASTGIGRGVAIPHPRHPISEEYFAIPVFFTKKHVDFGSVDGKPVWVLFCMFSPSTRIHLKLLSKLSFFLRENSFLENLKACRAPQEILCLIDDYESELKKKS